MEDQEQTPIAPLSLSIEQAGRGEMVTVVAVVSEDELHRDQLNLNRAVDRGRFARVIHDKLPRFTPHEVDSQLLKLRSDYERSLQRQANEPTQAGTELESLEVTRPELVIRRNFTAMAVPRLMQSRNSFAGEWTLYANANGHRSATELDPSIVIGDRTVFVHPMPGTPDYHDASELNRWSKSSRESWLRGEPAPTTWEVLQAVMARIVRYVELPTDDEDNAAGYGSTLSLWVLLTYCYPVFPAVPYLYLAGPAGSGKTRTMDLVGRLAFRPTLSSNTTAANLFRSLHARGGTLLLDEAERLRDDRSPEMAAISSILLSGYRFGGRASRMELIGDTFKSVSFDVYGPKLLACIRGLPPALASRCISIRLTRAATGSKAAARSLNDSPEDEQRIRDMLHCWMMEHSAKLLDTPAPASTLANRDAERWEPLLRIAALTEQSELVSWMLDHAARQIETDTEDATPEADPSLLSALFQLVSTTPRVTPGDVLAAAKEIDEEAFDGEWNARRVSHVLRRYGFRTTRNSGKRIYRMSAAHVESIARRYGYAITEADQ